MIDGEDEELGGGERKGPAERGGSGMVAKHALSRPGSPQRGEASAWVQTAVRQARSQKNGAGDVFAKPALGVCRRRGRELALPGMAIWKSSCTPIRADQYKCVSGGEVIW